MDFVLVDLDEAIIVNEIRSFDGTLQKSRK
jgi:hypothetical protein